MQETQETWVQSLGQEDPLEEEMAAHAVFLPGESHGQGSLATVQGLQRLNDLTDPLPSPLSVLGWRRIAMAPWSGLRATCRLHWVRPLPAPRPHCVGLGSAPCPSPARSAVGSRCSSVPPQAAGRARSNTRSSAGLLDIPGLCFLQGGRW